VYDLVRGDNHLYLVSELIEGRTLERLTELKKTLPPCSALLVADALLAALEAAHKSGLIHGSITPRAIMVLPNGGVMLDGFGLGFALGATESSEPTPQSDLYAVATLLHRLLTGAD